MDGGWSDRPARREARDFGGRPRPRLAVLFRGSRAASQVLWLKYKLGEGKNASPQYANNPINKNPRPEPGFSISKEALLLWAALLATLSGLLVRLLVLLIRLFLTTATLLTTLSGLLVLTALILIVLGHKYLPLFCEVWVE
jgi:hypothetical protein